MQASSINSVFLQPKRRLAIPFALTLISVLSLTPVKARSADAPQAVLVELFTSEGCSSCPPADQLLMDLDRKQSIPGASVVVLSEHVDYWNSLGWRDPYSSQQWSERQSDYGRRFGLDGVYTPQMVIDGQHQVVGSDSRAVRQAIEQAAAQPKLSLVISDVQRTADLLQITLSAGAVPHAVLYAAVADDSDRSTVQRGENAGRTLNHVAVVRSLEPVTKLQVTSMEKTIQIKLPHDAAKQHLRLILFAQDEKSGHIVGVATREL